MRPPETALLIMTGAVGGRAYAGRMAVQVDTSRALRRPDELAGLVGAVVQALETTCRVFAGAVSAKRLVATSTEQ
jgi:hypothetical protein